MFKPKFAPKVPIKSEPGEAQVPSNPEPTSSTEPNKNQRNEKDKIRVKKERDGDRDRNPQNRAGRGAGGRGPQWTMPAGAAFFTGNAPAQLAAKMNQSITIPVKSEAPKPSSSGVMRVARPNEVIDDDFPTQVTTSDLLLPEPDLEDTDSDRSDDDVAPVSSQLPEVWPPQKYNALDPLSLPFGPKTPQLRKILAQEAILAPPDDLEALDYEERTSLFLLQMPSDLKAVANGKLGKLQLLRSGKVRLVTNDGKSFDVKNGLAACFMQSLVTVDVSQSEAKPATEGEQSAPSKKKSKEAPVTSEQGTLHLMGNITKKLVLTPNYELGVRRKRSSSLSTQRAHRAAQEALGRARAGSEVVGGEEELLAEEEDFNAMDIMDVGE